MTTAALESSIDHLPIAEDHFHAMLAAVRKLLACDAAVLLRLDDTALVPVAVDGLSDEAMGRRFVIEAHPRLARLMASPQGLRFEADCGLPDPYDGLVADQRELLAVHDCMGAPLHHHGRIWGLITFDALSPHAFDIVTESQKHAVVGLLEASIAAAEAMRAMEERASREQVLARELREGHRPRELLSKSVAMQAMIQDIDTVAPSDLTVLILGETGVGKELVAQRVHASSARRDAALVQINCAALPETLADSELFGHRRGAFTGAVQDRVGKFELADGGTLFLDEVGELPLSVQAKLLRVLQSGELQRPGSDRLLHVDVRVLAATNRDLRREVAEGRFRADLYHRLSVFPLHVPPLRERERDVLVLAGGFLEKNQHRLGVRNLRLSPAASAALLAHDWPGNVRELEHLVSRAALRAIQGPGRSARWVAIEPMHLGLEGPTAVAATVTGMPDATQAEFRAQSGLNLRDATAAFQRDWIAAALVRHQGSMPQTAKAAGMDRSNFHRLARRLGVGTPSK
ncbi:nitric oxide reductase transcriptional regulator NorR [Paucibacter sp. R3-3]|uniref:Nitric oxide reductase transcriptional regulator NorR n=1 Tax=Roseateles agri TaxID=3098619 RepID=A0ABU5DRW0_9BURK|nr:nitric oxide reductase transcriptional regulator NorR [Paucibacter sp. R3-3]MDY0749061.1 nitric oxide reductase transcriptional regulator NorR [Paucibacter sp. R3-3]